MRIGGRLAKTIHADARRGTQQHLRADDYYSRVRLALALGSGRSKQIEQEQLLVEEIEELERDANVLLSRELGARPRTIFDLRADLARLGIWSADDVRDFDKAVRVRNEIVHAGVAGIPESAVSRASRTVESLIERLDTYKK